MSDGDTAALRWGDAALAARLLCVDPLGAGGALVRAQASPARAAWLDLVKSGMPRDAPFRRLPRHAGDDRLLGGLDLAATLAAGKPIAERGVLAACDGGVAVLTMAERMSAGAAARVCAVLDTAEVAIAREGLDLRHRARLCIVALDEGLADDERTPMALADRLAYWVDLEGVAAAPAWASLDGAALRAIAHARDVLHLVRLDAGMLQSLCAAALALGIASLRAPLLAARVARASAAMAGRRTVTEEDAKVAARLVFGPRATLVPDAPPAPGDPHEPQDEDPRPERGNAASDESEAEERPTGDPGADMLVAAAKAVVPPGLLADAGSGMARRRAPSSGKSGATRASAQRGRPIGAGPGDPRNGCRLSILDTLKAAAPWQRIRSATTPPGGPQRLQIRRGDFRVRRFEERSETATIFLVDASGSTAARRLGEAKGAVELLLAECYVRRDQVALLAFRGPGVELLLPPTRSLARAKRCLADLPGGGGTPLASAIAAGMALAEGVRRRGQTPTLVLLTDGSANITRDGEGDRVRAEREALATARIVRAASLAAVLVDTSQFPRPFARSLADALAARYLPLPRADAATLSRAVRSFGPKQPGA